MFNHKKIKQLQKKITLLQMDKQILDKDDITSFELEFKDKLDTLNKLIQDYTKMNHDIKIMKSNFQNDLNKLKNKL